MKKKYQTSCQTHRERIRRDCVEKMEALYGCPLDLPENDLKPRPGIVQKLVFCALVTGFGTIVYLIFNV